MVRSLKTVYQVWQEWSVGIHGGPAVRNLEEIHGSLWCNTSADKRFFFRRRKIIDHIIATAQAQCISHEQAICALETHRAKNKLTLNALSGSLKRST
ncbi:RNA polymerase [Phytophthora megakarya]|uniref:RNA polymerase n=1 Tax=Phytophthora megakarya TaxID=4795 RepID=A0A225W4M3_9STRA|nr:RNA polymerase [Phytophthora megakarya]